MRASKTGWVIPGIAASGLLFLFPAGCKVGPDYAAPKTTVPEGWGELQKGAQPATGAAPSTAAPDQAALTDWWTTFRDPALDSLIERALRANPDLRLAEARVREARAERGIVAADLFPTVNLNGSYARSRGSSNAFTTPQGTVPGRETDLYQVGFDASWEIDVFGGVRRGVEAADATIDASVESLRDVQVSLLAEVARNYMELRGAQRQAVIARANVQTQQETLDLTRARLTAGLASDLDVARAEAQVQTTLSQIPLLETSARQSIHLLSTLLGLEPNALSTELSSETPIPSAPPIVPVGLPSDLLRRRADVRRAERQLAAATAQIGAATADLFPRFSLTGSLGLQSSKFKDLGDYSSRFWSIGPSVAWPILDFGRIRSNINVQNAREEQAAVVYEQAVLTSLRDVEDALVAFSKEQARRQTLVGAVESNRRAADLANQLYQQGRSDFLSVLQAQRDLYVTENALVQSDQSVSSNLVALYKALGGGWDAQPERSPEPMKGKAGSREVSTIAAPTEPTP